MSDFPSVNTETRDHLVAVLKGALSEVPLLGGIFSELLGSTFPRQRLDRVAHFVALLEAKLSSMHLDLLDMVASNEELAGLLEDGLRQAACSSSDERRVYLAELVSRSITSQEQQHSESRHLLRILGQLSDIEVLWLHYLQNRDIGVYNRNVKLFAPKPPGTRRRALQDGYKHHLIQLGLIEILDSQEAQAQVPRLIAAPREKRREHRATALGKLLIQEIGRS